MLDDAAIGDLLERRIDRDRRALSVAVGVVSLDGRRYFTRGVRGAHDPVPVDADTLFEIGSATKVITALLLAEAVRRGEVALDDAAQDHLPSGVRLPERDGRITLRHLANHTSSLPMFPPGAPPFGDPAWSRYSAERLFKALADFVLPRPVGEAWTYSNTGYGLLGQALSFAAGVDYETLARGRVLAPLGMASTAIALSPALAARAATPHGADLAPTSRLQLPGLEGAGGFWSSAADMASFVAAALGLVETPLAAAFAAMLDTPRIRNPLGAEQALGWWVCPAAGGGLLNHDGGTAGCAASVFCDPATRAGVVVLANSPIPVSELARRILRPDEPGPTALAPPSSGVELTVAQLGRLVGVYEAASGAKFVIEREGAGLALQAPNAPRLVLAPTSETAFAAAVAGLDAAFTLGPDGRAAALVIDFAGRRTDARRAS